MRARGVGEVMALAGARLREAIASHETLIVLARPTRRRDDDGVEGRELNLRRLTAADASLYARTIGTDSESTFRARLSATSRCFAVELQGRLVHASWVTTGCAWTREIRSFICVADGDSYVYESFTDPGARGRGVYPFALVEICRELSGEGLGRLWVAVEKGNSASERAVSKAGFEEVFEIHYRRRLGRLRVDLPDGVKTDTTTGPGSKKRRIWLSGVGATKQWKP
jgi:RimJ/RimL family protein N-acetyltransferase